MKVSDLFVQCLENEGVKYVFGVPGEENEDLLFSLERSSIQFIPTRHEQGAAFMANMWGRITGCAGVCLSTLGPGATNLVTGIADAFLDKSPVVAITGQSGLANESRESHQYLDIVALFRPITKWNTHVLSPQAVPSVVRKAFKIAEMEKPGATHIELSDDIAQMESDARPIRRVKVSRSASNPAAISECAELLKQSRKPLILAGNGAVRKKASIELRNWVRELHIPVVHTFMGQGAISDASQESLLTIGFGFRDIVNEAIEESDLIITVGYDIAEYAPESWNPRGDKRIIHIDFTPAEVYPHYQPILEIVADISSSLKALRIAFGDQRSFDSSWFMPIRKKILEDIAEYDLCEGDDFTIPGVLNLLRLEMTEDDLLISDVGTHKLWIARNFPVYSPNCCIISNGLASMGIALPGAIAAALQNPSRKIVAVMGDGGFLMNSQEIETAKRVGATFTMIIFNDNDYGQISWKQKMHHDHTTGTRINNPDFVQYAQSFGIRGFRPTTMEDLKNQLKTAIHSKELCLIEIPVNQKVTHELPKKYQAEEIRS